MTYVENKPENEATSRETGPELEKRKSLDSTIEPMDIAEPEVN